MPSEEFMQARAEHLRRVGREDLIDASNKSEPGVETVRGSYMDWLARHPDVEARLLREAAAT